MAELLHAREAAQILGVSYSTLKQWIYHGKLRSVRTPGGHHRIPRHELDRYLHRRGEKICAERRRSFRRISGRNQLVGRVVEIRKERLLAQLKLSILGQQITSTITTAALPSSRRHVAH